MLEDKTSSSMGANLDERSLTWYHYSWWEMGDGRWEEDEPRRPSVPGSRIVNRGGEKIRKCKLASHALSYGYIIPIG